jgi:cytochrome c peroxidase
MSRLIPALLLACPGYTVCPAVNYPHAMRANPAVQAELSRIDTTEAATVAGLGADGQTFGQLVALLGKVLVFDRSLSATHAEACALCHESGAGFSGGISLFSRAGGVFPGANFRRTGFRAPPSLAYAGFAPVLTYRQATADFAGGTFWDSRATGAITGSAAADQAAEPLTSPFEMAFPDPACAVRRISLAPYGAMFGKVWGASSLAITWPANTDALCARLNDGGTGQTQLKLSAGDRATATTTVQQIGITIATFESAAISSPFGSKFDLVQAGKARFTPEEQRGYALFTGAAHCADCHTATGAHALFTDFTSANIGLPHNSSVPFLTENAPDRFGYVANPAGPAFIDEGLGAFLASPADTNTQWQTQAARFIGAFQVPTLRNVAAGAARSYMHNGYFTNLKMAVHFFNTRDVLPRCTGTTGIGTTGIGTTCWPAPEEPRNVDTADMGALGLTGLQEDAIVAFMRTLTDSAAGD